MTSNMKPQSLYSIRKARHVLKWGYSWYSKKRKSLSQPELHSLESNMEKLDHAIQQNQRVEADALAKDLEQFGKKRFKRTFTEYTSELIIALALALAIATLVRIMVFEPYEIPTGSMRPTFKEQDHIVVSKTTFGLNFPLQTRHIFFDPSLVQRGGIVIWSGDQVDLPDTDSTYMMVFPYKKRYIKRSMGLPGDTLYFYGGKIYGFDKDGHELTDLYDNQLLEKIDHVPFLNFEGKWSTISSRPGGPINQILLKQFNEPIGKLSFLGGGEINGEIFNGKTWIKDNPSADNSPHNSIRTYSDFWGMGNYAMTRLLTKAQVEEFSGINTKNLPDGVLYLELRHHPSLTYPKPRLVQDDFQRIGLVLTPHVTVIPLNENELKTLMANMYTARFVVMNGYGTRYSPNGSTITIDSPQFPNVPDGTYEFYFGKAARIRWGGISISEPQTSPLYRSDAANIQKLFNLGIEMSTLYEPHNINQAFFPSRYAYFRDGNLYVMGNVLLKKDDPTLIAFNKSEKNREESAAQKSPYIAFKDNGPPFTKDGKLDKEFIRNFGLKIPDRHYMMLGDNYAMSSDSRMFGFVPQENIQGTPSLIVWPPGERWGIPLQPPYPWLTVPHLIIWGLILFICGIWYSIYRYYQKKPIYKKLS